MVQGDRVSGMRYEDCKVYKLVMEIGKMSVIQEHKVIV